MVGNKSEGRPRGKKETRLGQADADADDNMQDEMTHAHCGVHITSSSVIEK